MDASRLDRLSRRIAGRTTRRTALGAALASMAAGYLRSPAAGQATPGPGPVATPAQGEKPVFMFVQTAASGRGEVNPAAGTPTAKGTEVAGGGAPFLLTLEGHTGLTVYFSDRPDRVVGAVPTDQFLGGFDFSPGNPPNAALVAEFQAGQGVVVMQLINPVFDPATGTLTYGAEGMGTYVGGNLEPVAREQVVARLPAEFGSAALFIDDCPNYTNCVMESWAMVNGQPIYVGIERVGPIPGGPYKACYAMDKVSCAPCDTELEKLTVLCNTAYPDVCIGACFPGS